MKNSLKEIIEGIISIVEGMDGLAGVEYTTSYEIAVDNTKDFPRLYLIVNSPSNILEQHNQVSIDFLFLDIMQSDVDHIQKDYEIKSDMAQQASILFDILEDQGYFGEDINITLEPITGEYMNGLSGMGCTVPFAIEKPCFEDGVPVLPFTVTIDTPTTGSEFEQGTDVTVTQSFSRVNGDITRVDLVVDGVVEDSHFVAPFDADFIISGLDLGAHSIYINAWEGATLADKSNTVALTVVRVPLTLTINLPTEGQEYVTGADVAVDYTFDRLAPEVDKVELYIDGVLNQTDTTAPFDTFTISAVTEGGKLIEVKAYEGATELAADSVNILVEAPAATLLLDIYPNTLGASWEMLQVNSAFTTTVLELRRDDNETLLVSFDAGELPLAAIAAWAGTGKAFVTKWYEQSGNGLFVQQTSAAAQPWIYDNGWVLESGLPAIQFNGAQFLDGGDILKVGANPLTSFIVAKSTVATGTLYAKALLGGVSNRYGILASGGNILNLLQTNTTSPDNVSYVKTALNKLYTQEVIPTVSHKAYENNVLKGSDLTLLGDGLVGSSTFNFLIGAFNDVSGGASPANTFHTGTMQAAHIFLNDIQANRSAITTEIIGRYGIV